MPRQAGSKLMVGIFATLALVVLAIAVMTVGGESRLSRGSTYRVTFADTDGLRPGSPVKMAGVQVGSVREIHLPTDPTRPGIEVVLTVDKSYAVRVREDSKASLRYLQLLSGEKYVQIDPGTSSRGILPEGGVIESSDERALLERGADIASNITEITVALRNILGPLERGEGLLGEMIHDPNFGKESAAHLRETLGNLEALTAQLRSGRGLVGRLLYDPEFAGRVDDISTSLAQLSGTMESISRREGAIGSLLNEGGAGQAAIEDLRDAAASLKRTVARLESKEGLVGRILNDPVYSDEIASDLKEVVHNLKEITGRVNRGEGTIGALVNERTVYDGLEDVVAGMNDSKFGRWLLRHYQKKGIKLETEGLPPAPSGSEEKDDPSR